MQKFQSKHDKRITPKTIDEVFYWESAREDGNGMDREIESLRKMIAQVLTVMTPEQQTALAEMWFWEPEGL